MIRSPLLVATATEQDGATRIGIVRVVVGALPLVAAGLARVLFGLPKKDDTPAVRTIARLFGIRNIVLGLWVLSVRDADADTRRRCYQLNAAVDALDGLALVWPVVRRQGLIRFGLGSATLAVSATLSWLELLERMSPQHCDERDEQAERGGPRRALLKGWCRFDGRGVRCTGAG